MAGTGCLAARGPPERRKPLRTYGKKRAYASSEVASDTSSQTTEKRRRKLSVDAEETSVTQQIPELPRPPVPPPSSSFEKGSILNYFKPSRASSSATSSDTFSDPNKLTSTPPSSPPCVKIRRTPRRLRLRPPTTNIITDGDEELGSHEMRDGAVGGRHNEESALIDSMRQEENPDEGTVHVADEHPNEMIPSKLTERQPLRSIGLKRGDKASRSKSAPIQTTINLTTKSACEECKICHIVYNPLHPADAKYHAKMHKTITRSKSRS